MAKISTATTINPINITIVDNSDTNNIYIGYAKAGTPTNVAEWQIRKVVTASNIISIKYANGTIAYDKVWDNRASYAYS